MGKTTAGLPLRAGEHYEKCPACATVYRTKRTTRFRCPGCHRLAYAVPTPETEPGERRTLEGDPRGRVFRVLAERPAGDPPTYGDDVVLFLEDPEAAPPAPDVDPPPPPGPGPVPRTDDDRRARRARDRGATPAGGILGRVWRGSLGELFRGR